LHRTQFTIGSVQQRIKTFRNIKNANIHAIICGT